MRTPLRLVVALLVASPVLAACSSDFDPGDLTDKLDFFHLNDKKKLPGERKELFPGGVPGVSQGIPPDLVKGYQAPAVATEEPQEKQEQPKAQPEKPKQKPKPRVAHQTPPKPKSQQVKQAPQPQQAQQQPQTQSQQQTGTQSPWPATQQQQTSPWPDAPAPNTFQR